MQDESICIVTCAPLLPAAALKFHGTSEMFLKISRQFQMNEDFTGVSRKLSGKGALCITYPLQENPCLTWKSAAYESSAYFILTQNRHNLNKTLFKSKAVIPAW